MADENKLKEQIKTELIEIRNKYGDERLTTIEPAIDFIDDEDLIEDEENVVTLTHFGYVKDLRLTLTEVKDEVVKEFPHSQPAKKISWKTYLCAVPKILFCSSQI